MLKLDEIALNIELVLISIIQGVALVKLAENSVPLLINLGLAQYLPYILSGLALLLAFWAQAILHAISFIRWPIRMEHMFLYFIAVFLQVVAYTDLTEIAGWFFWWTMFSLLVAVIYYVDLRIIRDMRPRFRKLKGGAEFLDKVEARHMYEFKYLVPIAIVFNILMCIVVFLFPRLFMTNSLAYTIPGILQLCISLGALIDCVRNFRERSNMLPALFE